jgi:hypothetical protein
LSGPTIWPQRRIRSEIGDIRHPRAIWGIDRELAIQRVVDHNGGLAALHSRLLFVPDLRLNACKAGQTGNAALRCSLAHIDHVVIDFAVAVNLTTVVSDLFDQLGLTFILQRTLA